MTCTDDEEASRKEGGKGREQENSNREKLGKAAQNSHNEIYRLTAELDKRNSYKFLPARAAIDTSVLETDM